MKKIVFIALTVFMCMNCGESNIELNKNYIGVWKNSGSNTTYILEVKSSGRAFYDVETITGSHMVSRGYEGYFNLEDSILSIGMKKLLINEPPMQTPTGWQLKMEDMVFKKELNNR